MHSLDEKLESLKLVNSFKDYLACQYVSHNDRYNFQKILFKVDKCSLYKKLYKPDMDLTLYLIIEKVFQIQKRKEIFKSFKKVIKQHGFIEKVAINQKISKYNTAEDIDPFISRLWRFEMHQEVHDHLNTQNTTFNFRKAGCETFRQDQRFFPLASKQGIDVYNNEMLVFIISQMLSDNQPTIKDSINVFYKGIDTYLDQENADYNLLLKRHGFKS